VAAQPQALVRVAVLHGPNLNLLGRREPEVYGRATLAEIDAALLACGKRLGVEVRTFQSNHEGALIEQVHAWGPEVDGFLINAGGYTHTSVALRDALLAVAKPFVEVHLSNLYAREPFRHRSLLADRAVGLVCGFGPTSYRLALEGLVDYLSGARLAAR